jgi:hypothetical protein
VRVSAIQNKNMQQNTATDAFNAGLFLGAWLQAAIQEQAVESVTGTSVATDAMCYFKMMKEYQAKLRSDNPTLCEATKVEALAAAKRDCSSGKRNWIETQMKIASRGVATRCARWRRTCTDCSGRLPTSCIK